VRGQGAFQRTVLCVFTGTGSDAVVLSSIRIFGSHCSQDGRYQFAGPRSFMLAGSSTDRITVVAEETVPVHRARLAPRSIGRYNQR
jgi:hypothetical protein